MYSCTDKTPSFALFHFVDKVRKEQCAWSLLFYMPTTDTYPYGPATNYLGHNRGENQWVNTSLYCS